MELFEADCEIEHFVAEHRVDYQLHVIVIDSFIKIRALFAARWRCWLVVAARRRC
jgi:hypothetical protein